MGRPLSLPKATVEADRLGEGVSTSVQLIGATIQIQMHFDDEYAAGVAYEEMKVALLRGDRVAISCPELKDPE